MGTRKTIIRRSIIDPKRENFGPDARIEFTLPNGGIIEISWPNSQQPRGVLNVRAINGILGVLPSASNDLYIMVKPYTTEEWADEDAGPKREPRKKRKNER